MEINREQSWNIQVLLKSISCNLHAQQGRIEKDLETLLFTAPKCRGSLTFQVTNARHFYYSSSSKSIMDASKKGSECSFSNVTRLFQTSKSFLPSQRKFSDNSTCQAAFKEETKDIQAPTSPRAQQEELTHWIIEEILLFKKCEYTVPSAWWASETLQLLLQNHQAAAAALNSFPFQPLLGPWLNTCS